MPGHDEGGRDKVAAATSAPPAVGATTAIRRWLPLIAVVAIAALAFTFGLQKYLSFKTIGLHYAELKDFIGSNLVLALAIYMAAYVLIVAFSLPGALVMTLSGGLLFGAVLAIPATVVAATG